MLLDFILVLHRLYDPLKYGALVSCQCLSAAICLLILFSGKQVCIIRLCAHSCCSFDAVTVP